jgi:hypothetical protein
VLDEWIERIKSTATQEIVRIIPLSNGNQRIDVTAGDTAMAQERRDGWMIRTIGGNAALTIATRGNAYVISNDRVRLETFLTTGIKMTAMKAESGFVDIGALRTFLKESLPVLSDVLKSPLLEKDGALRWSMKTTPGSVAIGWSWKKRLE